MYTPLNNKTVGQAIAKLRIHKGIKAFEVAKQLNMSVAAYTKHERGETAITIKFINAVAEYLNVNPLHFLQHKPENIVENIYHSKLALQNYADINNATGKDFIEKIIEQLKMKDKQIAQLLTITQKKISIIFLLICPHCFLLQELL